jgi:hypothetical protein
MIPDFFTPCAKYSMPEGRPSIAVYLRMTFLKFQHSASAVSGHEIKGGLWGHDLSSVDVSIERLKVFGSRCGRVEKSRWRQRVEEGRWRQLVEVARI